jgi:predicted NAD-dependent protein-ADP-ribosyltransferase YbiA (DUF1768 family)
MRLIELNESGLDDAQMAEYNQWCADTGVPEDKRQNAVLYMPSTRVNPWLSSRFQKQTNDYLFFVGEQGYYSAEHYFQAAKIDLLLGENDHLQLGLDVEKLINLRTEILNTVSVNEAVALTRQPADYMCKEQKGNTGENTLRSINDLLKKTSWYESQRFHSLEKATQYKFAQNPKLKRLLLATADAPIIGLTPGEHPAHHTWGTAYENGQPGNNQLGCILMSVRQTLKNARSLYQGTLFGSSFRGSKDGLHQDVKAILESGQRCSPDNDDMGVSFSTPDKGLGLYVHY